MIHPRINNKARIVSDAGLGKRVAARTPPRLQFNPR